MGRRVDVPDHASNSRREVERRPGPANQQAHLRVRLLDRRQIELRARARAKRVRPHVGDGADHRDRRAFEHGEAVPRARACGSRSSRSSRFGRSSRSRACRTLRTLRALRILRTLKRRPTFASSLYGACRGSMVNRHRSGSRRPALHGMFIRFGARSARRSDGQGFGSRCCVLRAVGVRRYRRRQAVRMG